MRTLSLTRLFRRAGKSATAASPSQRVVPNGAAPGLLLDFEIAAGLWAGDPAALDRLLDRHLAPLYAYLRRRLPTSEASTLEAISEATLAESIRKIRPYAKSQAKVPFDLWLINLSEKHVAKALRKERRRARRVARPQRREWSSDLDRLRDALDRLPRETTRVVGLAVFEEMTAREMAGALGTSRAGAMRRLRSALKRLASELDRQEAAG